MRLDAESCPECLCSMLPTLWWDKDSADLLVIWYCKVCDIHLAMTNTERWVRMFVDE